MHPVGCFLRYNLYNNHYNMNKQTFTKQKLDPSKYVNVDTGETLFSEVGVITSVNKPNGDYVKYKSKSFYMIDSEAIKYLSSTLDKKDMYYVYLMCTMPYGTYNLLHSKAIVAHTKETLALDLNLARVAFNRLLKRLYTKGVIYYLDGMKDGLKVKRIMLNPNLARSTNVIHKDCSKVFQTFT